MTNNDPAEMASATSETEALTILVLIGFDAWLVRVSIKNPVLGGTRTGFLEVSAIADQRASGMFNPCQFEFEIVSVNWVNYRLVELKKKRGARWNFRI